MRLVIFEENPAIRSGLQNFLNSLKLWAASAQTGEIGLHIVAMRLPDVILVSDSLPDMTAADVIAALRAEPAHRSIPVIVMHSGNVPPHIEAVALLERPVSRRQLVRAILPYANSDIAGSLERGVFPD